MQTESDLSLNGNAILRALPPEHLELLLPLLKPCALPLRYVFSEPGQEFRRCYFITSGMASTVGVMKDGSSAEIGVIGSEGLVGFGAMLGVNTSQNLTIMQIAGHGYSVDVDKLRGLFEEMPSLRQAVNLFVWSSLAFYGQTGGCNRFHSLEERMSRWLLTVRDRIQGNSLPLTHEFLSQMLGAHRSTVTLALGALERAGVLQNLRGRIELIDLVRLEQLSCECLSVIRKLPSFGANGGVSGNGHGVAENGYAVAGNGRGEPANGHATRGKLS